MIPPLKPLRSVLQIYICMQVACVLATGCSGAGRSDGRIVVVADDSSDRVTARLVFGYDPAQFPAGTAWMFAEVLAGTNSNGMNSEVGELTSLGASLAATAEREILRVDLTFPKTATSHIARLVGQRLSRLQIDSSRIDELRLIQHASLDSLRHEVDWLVQSAFWNAAYQGTPYSLPPTGSDSSIELIRSADVDSFRSRFITRGNYVLGLAGSVGSLDAATFDDQIQELLPAGGPANRIPPALPPSGLEVAIVELPNVPTTTISVGCSAPHLSTDTAAMVLAMTVALEAGPGLSITGIDQSIRVERGLAELVCGRTSWINTTQTGVDFSGEAPSSRDFLMFTVHANPTNALYSARIIIKELADISNAGISDNEIVQVHYTLEQAISAVTDSPTRMRDRLSRLWMGIESDSELLGSRPDALNLTQSRRILRTIIDPKNLWLIAVVPDAERFREEILSGMSTYQYPDWVDQGEIRRLDQEYLSYRPYWQAEKIQTSKASDLFR